MIELMAVLIDNANCLMPDPSALSPSRDWNLPYYQRLARGAQGTWIDGVDEMTSYLPNGQIENEDSERTV